jgi:hypothetical protein
MRFLYHEQRANPVSILEWEGCTLSTKTTFKVGRVNKWLNYALLIRDAQSHHASPYHPRNLGLSFLMRLKKVYEWNYGVLRERHWNFQQER